MDRLQEEQVKGGAALEDVHGVVVGSRAHLVRTEAVVKVSSAQASAVFIAAADDFKPTAVIPTQPAHAAIPYLPLHPRHSHNVSPQLFSTRLPSANSKCSSLAAL